MLGDYRVKTRQAGAPNDILMFREPMASLGIVVSNANYVEQDGRKLVKAGTPLKGDIDNRTVPFEVTTGNDATVILRDDVDVTNGNNNGTGLIFAFVNTNRIDSTTLTKITEEVKTALKGKITFIKG